ncbi:polysialyltransferase family glycosyltransferase [Pantoea sp.]|uniref:polysialyltransferase family glycosyltransferase n=1 Tax=Pantoea sp. TaxID=69393 RepID=UPI00290EDCDB|nr:polysialyltransferase family glycosyltransferase [Pantoea sp.]MDU5472099.1 polysialyltransferase family glycosyltransferase [Pantoea sp.]
MKRRLFISTGFYSTLLASVIASEDNLQYEDYLLITIDRQSVDSNRLWANRLHRWKDIDFINHEDFYASKINYTHSVNFFDVVFSPFPEMFLTITSAFPSENYSYYEEGLTSYYQFYNDQFLSGDFYFCLHPYIYNQKYELNSLPVKISKVIEKLEVISRCYRVPLIEGNNNVVIIGHGGFPDENHNLLMIEEYFNVIKNFSKKGYNVILLGHTRFSVDENLLHYLRSSNEINFKYIEHDSPTSDVFLLKNAKNIKILSGVYSTLLVNAKDLYGIEVEPFDSATLSERQYKLKEIQSLLLNYKL